MAQFQFQAQGASAYTFEDFLRDAQGTGITDPGSAMIHILRRRYVPGLDVNKILADPRRNPCHEPGNLLAFMSHVCEDGGWGVNLRINID